MVIGELAYNLARFTYTICKNCTQRVIDFNVEENVQHLSQGSLSNNIFINDLEEDMRVIQDANWEEKANMLVGKIRNLKGSNKPGTKFQLSHLYKSCDLTALNLFPHLKNADNNYCMELGEVHNIKGHPKRCSMQILAHIIRSRSTGASISCSNDTNTKKGYAEKVVGVLTDYRFNIK